jgi:hypothetical protein
MPHHEGCRGVVGVVVRVVRDIGAAADSSTLKAKVRRREREMERDRERLREIEEREREREREIEKKDKVHSLYLSFRLSLSLGRSARRL